MIQSDSAECITELCGAIRRFCADADPSDTRNLVAVVECIKVLFELWAIAQLLKSQQEPWLLEMSLNAHADKI